MRGAGKAQLRRRSLYLPSLALLIVVTLPVLAYGQLPGARPGKLKVCLTCGRLRRTSTPGEVLCPVRQHGAMVEPAVGDQVRVTCPGQRRRGQQCTFTRNHSVTEDEISGTKLIEVNCTEHRTEKL